MMYIILFITRLISTFIGVLANIRPPHRLNQVIINSYVRFYGVDTSEIENPVSSYPSIADFFVRKLIRKAQIIDSKSICSPVDGMLRTYGEVNDICPVIVKDQRFDWNSFLLHPDLKNEFSNGTFFNFYLSPKDYHHVHFPLAGRVLEVIHHPGGLLPVNDWSTARFPNLFCFNERVIAVIEGPAFRFLVVMIGAMNVGSIELAFNPGFKRAFFALKEKRYALNSNTNHEACARLGSFKLGSSVVCVFPKGVIENVSALANTHVKYGDKLASLR